MSKEVPYHVEAAAKAREIVGLEKDVVKKFTLITQWVSRNIGYDYIRAIKIPKRGRELPDVEGCWSKKMGICMDIASMTTGMLRAVGVAAYMCYGHTERSYHAWVEATMKGKTYRYDYNGKAKKYKREKIF